MVLFYGSKLKRTLRNCGLSYVQITDSIDYELFAEGAEEM